VSVGFGTAITATNSADITANGSVTAGGFGTGVSASTSSLVTVNGPVTADGLGLSASSGATIIANGIALGNTGGGAVAMMADNATIIANGITVTWPNGGGQSLVQALNGGLVQFTSNSSIAIPSGSVPSALLSDGSNSRIIADGLSISMGGSGGMTAARAQAGGAIELTGGSGIAFSGGGGNIGLLATGTNSTITATGLNMLVGNGGNDVGASAASGGQVTLAGGSVSVQGGGGETGLRATGAGSTLTATGVTVSVTGSGGNAGVNAASGGNVVTTGGSVSVVNGAGGLLQNGGSAVMTGTAVAASGSGGRGFLFNNGGSANTLQYSNGTITASDASFSVQGATANISLNGATATSNNNTLLETQSSGATIFNAQGSTLRGVISTESGSTSTVNLTANTVWTMTGSSNVTNLTNDQSLIQFTPPAGDPAQLASYKTLTTTSYVGAGGTLGLNTFLGSDGSPSDRLVINGGNASGSSLLKIANTAGAGALTSGNGILVVDTINAGTTNPGVFALAGPVVAGPYEYTLFRSSVDASNPQAWYLRSNLDCAQNPLRSECQVTPTSPPTPAPPPTPALPPVIPNYRAETSLYAAIPSMALLYGRNLLDTLHERVGEEEDQRGRLNPESTRLWWGRMIGVSGVQQGDRFGVLSGSAGPHFEYTFLGLQAGMDVFRHDGPDGSRDQAGAYFAIGGNEGRVTHFDGKQGDSDFAAYTIGGYWTHFGPTGWYLDAILQGTFYEINSTASRGLPAFKTVAHGGAASLEAGYPFKFANGFFIEPQAQLVYQNIHIDDANDIAARVRFADVDSVLARIGARFGRTWMVDDSTQRTISAWIRPNLWNEFRGDPITSFSSEAGFIPFHADLGGLWGEINAGVSGQATSNATLYANASYQSRFDGGGFAYSGKAGFRVNW
jgi:outer membrane autotransporter protein